MSRYLRYVLQCGLTWISQGFRIKVVSQERLTIKRSSQVDPEQKKIREELA